MNYELIFIDWQPDLDMLNLGGMHVRWYSMCWVAGLLLAYLVVQRLYKQLELGEEKFEPLFFYCFMGVLIGARLGHCLFYEPGYYLGSSTGFVEMLVPMHKMADGAWKFTGYEGLASHGGTIGLFLALMVYWKKYKVKPWVLLDCIGIAAPITSCFIRLGNLMNSEIIGNPTDMPWGFIFHTREALVNGELAPRHPAQLYEALAYLVFFIIGLAFYHHWRNTLKKSEKAGARVGSGFYFGLCLATIFTFRFFIEFLKKEQVDFEQGMLLDMGQLLSIPMIIVGVWCTVRALKVKN